MEQKERLGLRIRNTAAADKPRSTESVKAALGNRATALSYYHQRRRNRPGLSYDETLSSTSRDIKY